MASGSGSCGLHSVGRGMQMHASALCWSTAAAAGANGMREGQSHQDPMVTTSAARLTLTIGLPGAALLLPPASMLPPPDCNAAQLRGNQWQSAGVTNHPPLRTNLPSGLPSNALPRNGTSFLVSPAQCAMTDGVGIAGSARRQRLHSTTASSAHQHRCCSTYAIALPRHSQYAVPAPLGS